jgi:Concanavalin A-like lectin/glucanases superfamily
MPATSLLTLAAVTCVLTGLTVAAPAGTAAAASPVRVALWHMDERAGATRMIDSSGRGNDGKIGTSVVTGAPGMIGSAYQFDGSSAIVTVPDAPSLNPGSAALQIDADIKVPANLGVGDYNVLEKGTAAAAGGAYKLEIHGLNDRQFAFPDCAFNGPGQGKTVVYGPRKINDGVWHRVTCVLTATEAWLAIDGVSGPTKPNRVGSIANHSVLTIGGKPNGTHFFRGSLDEVVITVG